MPLSKEDEIYLAGIIDGEGCVSLQGRLSKYVTPSLQITNTDRRLIDWLSARLGGYVYERKDVRPGRKPNWLWCVFGERAHEIIRVVYPHLLLKKEQAEVVMNIQNWKHAHSLSRDSSGRYVRYDQAVHAVSADAMAKIRGLNKRGVALVA